MSDFDDGFAAFFEKVKQNPQYDSEKIKQAYDIAKEAHQNQKRRSGEPYIMHPVAVAQILLNSVWITSVSFPPCCTMWWRIQR